MSKEEFEVRSEITKVDASLGVVMGYAIVCNEDGEPYYDLQGDHIPEDSMLKAATDFMANSRTAKEMHQGEAVGSVVFAWPMTSDIAKSFGFEVKKTGLLIGFKPDDQEILEKYRLGELTGFSIGGRRITDEEV